MKIVAFFALIPCITQHMIALIVPNHKKMGQIVKNGCSISLLHAKTYKSYVIILKKRKLRSSV